MVSFTNELIREKYFGSSKVFSKKKKEKKTAKNVYLITGTTKFFICTCILIEKHVRSN